jgi:hypothetical protein
LLAAAGCPAAAGATTPADFWVATDGSDTADGSRAAPFATLERARDAAREVGARDVTITVRGGTYRLAGPLVLDARDGRPDGHRVVYRTAPGETPVLSGAVAVHGWEPYDGRIQRALVGDVASRQLVVNGRRATRARTADYPASFRPTVAATGDAPRGGILYLPNPVLNPPAIAYPELWSNPGDVEAVMITQWKMASCPVERIVAPGVDGLGLIVLREPAWTNANVFRDAHTGEPGIWSFWQVTRFENALEFLDEPGEWYLERSTGYLYYMPLWGEDLASAAVELPIRETLLEIAGTPEAPVANVRFTGFTFTGATWLGPSGPDGYVADQAGFHLTGPDHPPNYIGHDQHVTRTPGNVRVRYGRRIEFSHDVFEHLGAVALDLEVGCQSCRVFRNAFREIASAAVQIGGVSADDARPPSRAHVSRANTVSHNTVYRTGRDYVDSAAIFVGFTERSVIRANTIVDVPWSGIALGWGWGLLDEGSFPGLPGALRGQWGTWDTPTVARDNRIVDNRIEDFLAVVWDGGAVYTTGQQGPTMAAGTLVAGNVASGKRPLAGGNTFYTDGGSRYVTLRGNVSFDNPQGLMDFGPCPNPLDPLPYPALCLVDLVPYGGDSGGCVTYGDIRYLGNYWLEPTFFDICPYRDENGVAYPVRLRYRGNRIVESEQDVPRRRLR